MPTAAVNDLNIYYEVHGEGQPIVIIPGLRNDVSEYANVIAELSRSYQVVAADNRGAGRTDKPDIPYSIEMMADDTAGLLDTLGIQQAHILGVSMGGRIAVALTLRHPELVRSLILVSTNVKRLPRPPLSSRILFFAFSIPIVRDMIYRNEKYPQPYYALLRQREASRNFDCMDRLSEIAVPTLILHGKKDRLAPVALAEAMHAGIKGSKMTLFNGGHLFLFFQPRQFIGAVLEFLETFRAG